MSWSFRKRFSSLLIPTLVLVVLIHEIWTTPVYTKRDLASMREAAVTLAKQGDIVTALERLRALSEVAPHDRGVWGDYLSVLIRTGHDEQALALYRNKKAQALPDYTLAELFDAALRQQDAALAREIADREIAQSRDRDTVAAARERALNDSALLASSSQTVQQAESQAPIIAAESGAALPIPSVASSLKKAPSFGNKNRIAQPTPSRRSVPAEPVRAASTPVLPPHISISLADKARDAVRAAEQAPAAERVALAEAALPVIHKYAATLPADSEAARNATLDQVRALTLANRLDEAAALFESLPSADQLPLYGAMNGADLYARRHEPERACELLDRAQRLQPDSREIAVTQFYNQLDLEQFDRAAESLSRVRELSDDEQARRDAEVLDAMFTAYQNRLDAAQRKLERLQDAAPDDGDIKLRLAQIYRWRGWPRRTLAEYRTALEADDNHVPARLGEISALNDLHAFKQARAQLQQLAASTPAHPDVIQAQHDQYKRERWEYSAQVMAGQSSESQVNGSSDIAFEQKMYSPPIADQARAFVHQRYDSADFVEGSGSANRIGVGGDYRSQQFDGAVEVAGRHPDGRVGVSLNGEWKFDDRFSLFGEAQSDSTQIPLRALRAGIEGYSTTVGALYRLNESQSMRASYGRTEFSDDNNRDAIATQYRHSVYRDAHNQLTVIAQAYFSRNSAGNNVPYFNPDEDVSIGVAALYEGMLWRRYQRSWSQRIQFGVGDYSQQHFGSGVIWDVEYEQRWQLNDALNFNYGVLYRSRLYDGEREGYSAIFGGVHWRF